MTTRAFTLTAIGADGICGLPDWPGREFGRGRFGSCPWSGLGPHGQSLGNEFGADDRHLARGVESKPDLAPLKTDDSHADVVSDEELFLQLAGQHQHGSVPSSNSRSMKHPETTNPIPAGEPHGRGHLSRGTAFPT